MNQEEKDELEFKIKLLYRIRDFLRQTARPMTFLIYTMICVCDFVIFPFLWALLQVHTTGVVGVPWIPLTNSGGGIFHLSFGAILGVSAFTRGKEKAEGND